MKRVAIQTIVFVVVIIFIFRFVATYRFVIGDNMQPTLYTGDCVIIDKLIYVFHSPERGDVISFRDPRDKNQYSISRVIGLPGDTIKYNDMSVWINGVRLQKLFYITLAENYDSKTLRVPPNSYFVLKDNQLTISDWVFIPTSDIEGKAVEVLWRQATRNT